MIDVNARLKFVFKILILNLHHNNLLSNNDQKRITK